MAHEQGDSKHENSWPRIAWGTVAALFIASFLIGFLVRSIPAKRSYAR
jgi:hypothetical protein